MQYEFQMTCVRNCSYCKSCNYAWVDQNSIQTWCNSELWEFKLTIYRWLYYHLVMDKLHTVLFYFLVMHFTFWRTAINTIYILYFHIKLNQLYSILSFWSFQWAFGFKLWSSFYYQREKSLYFFCSQLWLTKEFMMLHPT